MEPRQFDFPDKGSLEDDKWEYPEISYNGSYSFATDPDIRDVSGKIQDGIAQLKDDPDKYYGIFYQTSMTGWPVDQQKYSLVVRDGSGFHVTAGGEGFTFVKADYHALPPVDTSDQDVDDFTDTILYKYGGQRLGPPICPGRGDGVCDSPLIKLIGDADPNDVYQGSVGDCWLLSAISACAEFEGVIEKIFENTDNLIGMPDSDGGWNKYSIALYDTENNFERVALDVDERLCSKPGGGSLLSCQPSPDGELWACLIEKAFAAMCGGWDEIEGGRCSHAWKILLGVRDCCTISPKGGGYACFGALNPNTGKWDKVFNAPHKNSGVWPMPFPELGGGGKGPIDSDDLFERMVLWDSNDYIIAAGSKQGSGSDKTSTGGIVDSHAYSVLKCIETSNGTQLMQLRNPWGKSEFAGKWADNADAWDENPDVRDEVNPVFEEDGEFWMEKDEFFQRFSDIYLCPMDMKEWVAQ